MSDPETENAKDHMLESNVSGSGSSGSGSDVESTSSNSKTNSTESRSEDILVQYDPSKDNVVFTNNVDEEKQENGTGCEYCTVLDKENEECSKRIAELEERCSRLEQSNSELNLRLELVSSWYFLTLTKE